MQIVLATRNRKKMEELSRMFAGYDMQFMTLDAFPGCPDVIEDGKTFRQNALKKAAAVTRCTGLPSLADDSGLEVEALGGEPGVYSARYAGEKATDADNVRKLLKALKQKEGQERKARFVCCIAFALPNGTRRTFSGFVAGTIGKRRKGSNGFGYDPVFYPEGHGKTFAEMADDEKDGMSHRGRAIRKFARYIKRLL